MFECYWFFKVVIYETNEGDKMVGYEMPYKNLSGDLKQYIVKILDIEAEIRLNFLSKIPQREHNKLETVIPVRDVKLKGRIIRDERIKILA